VLLLLNATFQMLAADFGARMHCAMAVMRGQGAGVQPCIASLAYLSSQLFPFSLPAPALMKTSCLDKNGKRLHGRSAGAV
jgi:hypothetical protein